MSRKIRVMMLISHMGDGGAQKIVINYLRGLKNDNDIELVLYVYNKSKINSTYSEIIKQENLNVKFLNVKPIKYKIPIVTGYLIKKNAENAWYEAIKEYNPDIIHIHIAGLVYNVLNPIKKLNKKIVFTHLHGHPNRSKGCELMIIRKSFKKYNFIPLCVTEEIAQACLKYYKTNKYELIYNGIDIEKIKSNIISKDNARNKLGLEKDKFIILGVGRLNKVKRFDLLIKVYSEYYKINKNALLVIAGDGPELNSLKDLIDKLGLSRLVKLMGNESNIVHFYCASDVLLITSKVESSSLVLLEAQLCGLKCIISKGVPNESVISDNVIKVEKDLEINNWIDAINNDTNYILKNKEEDDYDLNNNIKRLKNIYLKYWNYYSKQNH